MKYKHILLTFSLLAIFAGSKAQVTIGSDKVPESYSLVQVEGTTGGVLLPRIKEADKLNMNNKLSGNLASNGLTVFNIDSGNIEFWDGTEWIIVGDKTTVSNGLIRTDDKLELGGKLVDPQTIINHNNFNLDFTHTSPGGQFSINAPLFSVTNKDVSIKSSNIFSINSPVLEINANATIMQPTTFSVNDIFTMKGGTSSIGNRIKIDKSFVYSDGTEHSGYLLTSDASGNAHWEALRPLGAIIEGKLNDNIKIITSANTDITSQAITLPPGQWLVFAKCTAQVAPAATVMYFWILLRKCVVGMTNNVDEVISGYTPEKRGPTDTVLYSTPNMVHYVNVDKPTEFRVLVGTSNGNTSTTTYQPWIGNSFFYAVRLDVPK